jgi:hypothetical protein
MFYRVIGSPVNLIEEALRHDEFIDGFCGDCDAWTEEHSFAGCAECLEPSDSGCLLHSVWKESYEPELRALQRGFEEILSMTPADVWEGR